MKETALLALGFLVLAVAGAEAQTIQPRHCAHRDTVVARLAEGYGESRQSIGLGADNSVMELFASPETGTWTITVTLPNGLTCLVASGQAYETLAEEPAPKGETDA